MNTSKNNKEIEKLLDPQLRTKEINKMKEVLERYPKAFKLSMIQLAAIFIGFYGGAFVCTSIDNYTPMKIIMTAEIAFSIYVCYTLGISTILESWKFPLAKAFGIPIGLLNLFCAYVVICFFIGSALFFPFVDILICRNYAKKELEDLEHFNKLQYNTELGKEIWGEDKK